MTEKDIVTINGIPVFAYVVESDEARIERVSLVDAPAVMRDFQKFAKSAPVRLHVEDEDRRLVLGVVARADFPIYRNDNGSEYYGIFSADTIRLLAEKYLREGLQNKVNLMHEDGTEVDGVEMVQFFLQNKGAGVAVKGFEDMPDGTLFAEYHVTNDDVWNKIKDGTYRGFSLEGVFDLLPVTNPDYVQTAIAQCHGEFANQSKKNNMAGKFKKLKELMTAVLAEFKQVATDKGILSWTGDDEVKAGALVSLVAEDGTETTPEDGDYTADDYVITVKNGKVSEVREKEASGSQAKEQMRSFKAQREKHSVSYSEKEQAILGVLTEKYGDYVFLQEAGDDYVIACVYDPDSNRCKYIRNTLSWEGETPSLADEGEEVKHAFVPVNARDQREKMDEDVPESAKNELNELYSIVDGILKTLKISRDAAQQIAKGEKEPPTLVDDVRMMKQAPAVAPSFKTTTPAQETQAVGRVGKVMNFINAK